MKRLLLLLLPFFYVLTSCHKDNTAPANTVTANISGAVETFGAKQAVTKNQETTTAYPYNLVLKASTLDDTFEGHTVTLHLFSRTPITTGTYKFKDPTQDWPNNAVITYYVPAKGFTYGSNDSQPDPAIITITSITDHNIKGTFSGNLFGDIGDLKSVTNGKFNINY